MTNVRLTPNFWLSEFTASQTAERKGIDNTPSDEIVVNLRRLAIRLERVRSLFGNRVVSISSGYRCPALNAAIGGSPSSDHMKGLAADFVIRSYGTPYAVCQKIEESAIPFRQLIHEYGRWVHLAIAESGNLDIGQLLTICDSGSGYKVGISEC